jgi:hypothetical protein
MTLDSNSIGFRRLGSSYKRGACYLALAAACFASHGSAQEADAETRTAAREMATQGAEAFEKQDYETALDRFQRASSLFRAPSISVMEARTLVKLGRLVAALDKYEETRHTALPADASEALQRAVNDAARESEELRARVPLLRISLVGKPLSVEAKVTIDGKPVPAALLDVERPVDPGHHAIEATAAGLSPVRRSIELVQGEHRQVDIQFGSSTPSDRLLLSPQAEQRPTPGANSTPRNPLTTWGWAATGLGAVGLGTSLVTGVVALGKKSDLDSACHPGCPQSSSDTLDSFRFNRTLSYASFVVGAAALGVGGYILLSGSRESSHVSASLSPDGAALSGAF